MSMLLPQSKPVDVPRTMQQALALHHQGRLADAERLYATVLGARPDHFDALQMLGVIKLARGDHGMALEAMKRHEDALKSFDEAIRRKSRFPEAHNNRGSALLSLERYDEALESFRRAVALKSDYAEAVYNQGNALRMLNRYDEALACFDRALALRPQYAKAHCNRGAVLEALGRSAEALACFDRAIAIQPDFPEALLNRCGTLRALRRFDEMQTVLDALIAAHPAYAEAHYMRGMLMADFNEPMEALKSYDRAVALKPDYSKARWASCMAALPILYADATEIDERRADYERRLRALCDGYAAGRVPGDMTKGLGMAQPFFLAYQGRNDRDLQRLFGGLAARVTADKYGEAALAPPPAPGEPVRVGIVSGFFWQHSVWKVGIKGWVKQLDPKRFQVFGYNTTYKHDAETEIARKHCRRFEQGPHTVEQWRKIILADRPHVLIYPEIGMNHEASELAAMRLAPTQCSYIGHPQTSGMPTVDIFLSGELIEPPDGDAHYSERLVRLPNIAFHYEPLELQPVAVTRQEFGIRQDAVAYWCAQSLFKYLPQYDDVFPRIAREMPDSQFVFIRHIGHGVTELFQQRLERTFAAHGLDAAKHCVLLDSMDMNRFSAASALCDAMLDSIGWSGGNTTLEALAQDLPVVTYDAELMRGRVSAGMLRMMGMPETIGATIDDYVALAVRIGRDAAWRAEIKARVIRDREKLYCDRACIAALEDVLDRAARTPRP